MEEHRPTSKRSCSVAEPLPPIPCTPPLLQVRAHQHQGQTDQNTQAELNEFRRISSSPNVTERRHRGTRKDAPNPLTGRLSPSRKKRTITKAEPKNLKKHHCGLFDGPAPKPDRKHATGFFHPGLASIQGNVNTFQPHVGNFRVPQSARKFMVKETTYRVDTVHGHRVPVEELEFGHGHLKKWKRKLSPIKRKADQNDRQSNKDDPVTSAECEPQPFNDGQTDTSTKDSEDATNKRDDAPSTTNDKDKMNPLKDKYVEGVAEGTESECRYPAESHMTQDSSEIKDETITNRNRDNLYPGSTDEPSSNVAVIKDSVEKLVESIVSRLSPEVSENIIHPNPLRLASPVTSPSDIKQSISIGIQTDWKELERESMTNTSLVADFCSKCTENNQGNGCSSMNETEATLQARDMLCTPPIDERQKHGCVESYPSQDKIPPTVSDEEVPATNDEHCTNHETMTKGTMTPTKQGWESLDNNIPQEQQIPAYIESTTPLGYPPEPLEASQHIIEVSGLGQMTPPIQDQQAILPEVSDMDIEVSESVSTSDERLPEMLIEDSGGDYTPGARTQSRMSIFTLGHGDQRAEVTTPLSTVPSPQQGGGGNSLVDESMSVEGHTPAVDSQEESIQESRNSSRAKSEADDVQELIDNLIAERLNVDPEPEILENEPVNVVEDTAPLDNITQSATLKNQDPTDHQCDLLKSTTPCTDQISDNHPDDKTGQDTEPLGDTKLVTPTGKKSSPVGTENGDDDGEGEKHVQKQAELELQDAFLAMGDAVSAAKLIIRYLGLTDARLREALHRTGSSDEVLNYCPAAERVAQEAHAFAVRTQSVFMTYYRLAEAEDTFREFVLREIPGADKERRQLRRWWTANQPPLDNIPDEKSDRHPDHGADGFHNS